MRRHFGLAVSLAAVICVGCGDDDDGGGGADASVDATVLTAALIPGGGANGGNIAGTLHVFAIDEDTDAPLVGATVRVGTTLTGTTDGTGKASFTDASLTSKQTVLVTAPNYAAATWIGINAANITIPLKPHSPLVVTPQLATVSGSITGWDTLAVPTAANHFLVAIVLPSSRRQLGDDINIDQGMRNVTVGAGTIPIGANTCVRAMFGATLVSDCNWTLKTEGGPQAHLAIIAEIDDKGTMTDADNTVEVKGYALRTGLNIAAGATVTNEALTQIATGDVANAMASFSNVPTGLAQIQGFPTLQLGAEGQFALFFAALSPTAPSALIPRLAGPLGGAHYDLIAQAQATAMDERPKSLSWQRNVNIASTIAVSSWLPPAANLTATPATRTFSHGGVTGATVMGIDLTENATVNMEKPIWTILAFDGTTSVTLPTLTPDPLPATGAKMKMKVTGIDLGSANIQNFKIDELQKTLVRLSEEDLEFTR